MHWRVFFGAPGVGKAKLDVAGANIIPQKSTESANQCMHLNSSEYALAHVTEDAIILQSNSSLVRAHNLPS